MKYLYKTLLILLLLDISGCSGSSLFTGYRKEAFPLTRVTENSSKTIQILNESPKAVQHILGIAFYADSNKNGHFQVSEVKVGSEKVGLKDVFIPPMGVLNLEITYAPLDIETSEAAFNGWITTPEDRGALDVMSDIITEGDEGEGAAIHRAMLMVAYDEPDDGYNHIELVGGAIEGPNGETEAVGLGGTGEGDCSATGSTACFRGTFSIDMPGLMSGGALEVPLSGPIPLKIEGGAVELNLDDFPPVLIVVKGNGPGEPLEGKPVDAISIVISGTPESLASGTFDGRNLNLSSVAFRIRVLLGEITKEDVNPGLAAAVDFNLHDLEMTTDEPFDGSKIIFGVETTLSANPSGNGLFDSFLGGARVIVKFNGMLELP